MLTEGIVVTVPQEQGVLTSVNLNRSKNSKRLTHLSFTRKLNLKRLMSLQLVEKFTNNR